MKIVPPDLDAGDDGQFTAEERAIFAYDSSSGGWAGDPLAIEARYHEALAEHNAEAIDQWLKRKNLTVQLLALRKLLPVVTTAFAVPSFDEASGVGITREESLGLLRRFFGYRDRITARYRRDAEMLATYGAMPRRTHSYERHCGLWWNRDRVQSIAAVAHWRGASASSGTSRAHFSLADAMAPTRVEAVELDANLEANRIEAMDRARSHPRG